jgi:hypothetical protein
MTRLRVLGLAVAIAVANSGCGSISKYDLAGFTSAGGGTILQGNTGIASRHPGDVGIGSSTDTE